MATEKKNHLLLNLVSIILCILFLFPLGWLLVTSLKSEYEVFATPPTFLPKRFYWGAYLSQLNGQYNIYRAFLNSTVISTATMVLSTVLSIPAAYGLARFKIRGKKFFILTFLVTQMLPASLILTPLFIIFNKLNLINTYASPIIACATIAIPFSVLILRTYFLTIPKELDESARIDGCSPLTAFIKIMVPIAMPGVVVATVFGFLFAWGNLIYGLTFINKDELRPITVGIYNNMQQYGTSWNAVMAFGAIAILPVVVIFVSLQKYIISGLTNGAVKG